MESLMVVETGESSIIWIRKFVSPLIKSKGGEGVKESLLLMTSVWIKPNSHFFKSNLILNFLILYFTNLTKT